MLLTVELVRVLWVSVVWLLGSFVKGLWDLEDEILLNQIDPVLESICWTLCSHYFPLLDLDLGECWLMGLTPFKMFLLSPGLALMGTTKVPGAR